jgi:rubrerythrin
LRGQDRRRGFGRAVAVLWLAAVAALLLLGCGKSGHGAETDPEKGSDAAILNAALSRELTAAAAYSHGIGLLHGRLRSVGREFLAQEQEYADAITKAIRGLGGETEAEAEQPDLSAVKGASGFLAFAYELENADLAAYLDAAPRLNTAAPRALVTSLAAGHAQHLVVLRQALGADLAAAAPQAFDGGEEPPPPGAPPPRGR